ARWKSQRPITKHMTPAASGTVCSEYSAKRNTGDATQIRGTKNPIHARTRRPVSSGVLWLLAVLTLRLRRPCGARMAIITTVAASTTAFATHGFMAPHRSLSRQRTFGRAVALNPTAVGNDQSPYVQNEPRAAM